MENVVGDDRGWETGASRASCFAYGGVWGKLVKEIGACKASYACSRPRSRWKDLYGSIKTVIKREARGPGLCG